MERLPRRGFLRLFGAAAATGALEHPSAAEARELTREDVDAIKHDMRPALRDAAAYFRQLENVRLPGDVGYLAKRYAHAIEIVTPEDARINIDGFDMPQTRLLAQLFTSEDFFNEPHRIYENARNVLSDLKGLLKKIDRAPLPADMRRQQELLVQTINEVQSRLVSRKTKKQ